MIRGLEGLACPFRTRYFLTAEPEFEAPVVIPAEQTSWSMLSSLNKSILLIIACTLSCCLTAEIAAQSRISQQQLVDVNGVQVYVEVDGTGPPLLMLHGFTGSSSWWKDVVPALTDDFTVIVPDLPGHGKSSGRPGPYRFDQVATDMLDLMDELGFEEEFNAIGYSGGGITLLQMAKQMPARLESMVVVSTPLEPSRDTIVNFPEFENHPSMVRDYWLKIHPGGKAQVESLIASFHELGEEVDRLFITDKELSSMTGKTLLVLGDADPMIPLEDVMYMREFLPDASLWVVPNQGHSVIWPAWGGSVEAASIFPDLVIQLIGKTTG